MQTADQVQNVDWQEKRQKSGFVRLFNLPTVTQSLYNAISYENSHYWGMFLAFYLETYSFNEATKINSFLKFISSL